MCVFESYLVILNLSHTMMESSPPSLLKTTLASKTTKNKRVSPPGHSRDWLGWPPAG